MVEDVDKVVELVVETVVEDEVVRGVVVLDKPCGELHHSSISVSP